MQVSWTYSVHGPRPHLRNCDQWWVWLSSCCKQTGLEQGSGQLAQIRELPWQITTPRPPTSASPNSVQVSNIPYTHSVLRSSTALRPWELLALTRPKVTILGSETTWPVGFSASSCCCSQHSTISGAQDQQHLTALPNIRGSAQHAHDPAEAPSFSRQLLTTLSHSSLFLADPSHAPLPPPSPCLALESVPQGRRPGEPGLAGFDV